MKLFTIGILYNYIYMCVCVYNTPIYIYIYIYVNVTVLKDGEHQSVLFSIFHVFVRKNRGDTMMRTDVQREKQRALALLQADVV